MAQFELISKYQPTGDQPEAIRQLTDGLKNRQQYQTLLGVTGSGKTFTMANVIQNVQRPTLIISHNKTLAAQLYSELKGFFPNNAVEFFISYYDYYQPEAYIASTDTYIEKDTSINDEIDRLRLRATSSLLSRDDVILVASVSCIYGLGSPADYHALLLMLETNQTVSQRSLLRRLIDMHYTRNDIDFHRGTFRVRGDVIEIFPAYDETAIRVEMWGDTIEKVSEVDPLTGHVIHEKQRVGIFPAKHYVVTPEGMETALDSIEAELENRLAYFRKENKLLEAQRLESRTHYDIEMMMEVGYCSGIENYSRHMSDRKEGERPYCLLDFFPDDYLMIIDESHASIPQVRAMYNGDRARKTVLVEHGFRLPSALDNRPLKFEEFETMMPKTIFLSATPGDYELEKCEGVVVEQIIRPTGLLDPQVIVRPTKGQIDDLVKEIRLRTDNNQRVLVTTLTKRMAEDLADYLAGMDVRVRYLHSEIDALDRVEILRNLRLADFDVLVGINLLREGLDLPEVSLVAILDADKEGFLRSERSLMQTAGRAARNAEGLVILYADKTTAAMQLLIDETERRRKMQNEYNVTHQINPKTIYKTADEIMAATRVADSKKAGYQETVRYNALSKMEKEEVLEKLEQEMRSAAAQLEFERAAQIRDQIEKMKSSK